jgi:hypothetical protein
MRKRSRAVGQTARVLVSLILATLSAPPLLALSNPRPAEAVACKSRFPGPPPSPGKAADLHGVAVLSACNVWAVGSSAHGPLIEHWNGLRWKVLASPAPRSGQFSGVSAVSPASIWAVGAYTAGTVTRALIAHWDGTSWRRAESPRLSGRRAILTGVQAVSNRNVWAVGIAHNKALILHWNGTSWARADSPSPGTASELDGVSATAAGDVWAVGSYTTATAQRSLILHRADAKWVRVRSPHPGSGSELLGVSVMSPLRAWAVGDYFEQQMSPFAERWNGTSWRLVRTLRIRPPGYASTLLAVAAVSGHDVWAVGTDLLPVALHWNGSRWQIPDEANVPGTFEDVAADRAGDAWAVGNFVNGSHSQALAVRLH